jgi:hypothetical protein
MQFRFFKFLTYSFRMTETKSIIIQIGRLLQTIMSLAKFGQRLSQYSAILNNRLSQFELI